MPQGCRIGTDREKSFGHQRRRSGNLTPWQELVFETLRSEALKFQTSGLPHSRASELQGSALSPSELSVEIVPAHIRPQRRRFRGSAPR